MPQIIPIRDLKKTAEISEICHSTNEPIFITKNGYSDMVLMSMDVYEETMAIRNMVSKINQAEIEIKKGNVMDARKSLKNIREKYNV